MTTARNRKSAAESAPLARQTSRRASTDLPARTQAQRREESTQRLVNAALKVLATKGWVGMTLTEVGESAGVSRGLASHHFGNKAGLLREITLQIDRSFDAAMQTSPPPRPGLEAVLNYVSVYLGRKDKKWTSTRTLLLLMAEALVDGSENAVVLATYMQRMFKYLEDNIRTGIESGEIHPGISPRLGAESVIGMMRGVMLQRLMQDQKINVSDMHAHALFMLRRAFAP